MHAERIKQLIDRLRVVPKEEWDFGSTVTSCGSAGCTIFQFPKIWPDDWACIGPSICPTVPYVDDIIRKYAEWLEIDKIECLRLFFSTDPYGVFEMCHVTPIMVANVLENLIRGVK